MRRRRLRLLLAVLLYLTLDLSVPEMPGAFVFDPTGSVESIQAGRGRTAVEAVALPVPSGRVVLLAGLGEVKDRPVPTPAVEHHGRPVVRWRPRAASSADPTSSSEDSH